MKRFVLKKQKNQLTCKEATKMVIPYIKGQLGDAELRRFVAHIKECHDCREELETYYIVYKGLMQLDEKEELPMNIIEALNDDFFDSEKHLKNLSLFYTTSEVTKWMVNISCTVLMLHILMELIMGVVR